MLGNHNTHHGPNFHLEFLGRAFLGIWRHVSQRAGAGAGLFPPTGTRVDFRSAETWFGIGESFAAKASIVASILNLFRVNADADKVSGVILKIDDAGGDAIDLVAFFDLGLQAR